MYSKFESVKIFLFSRDQIPIKLKNTTENDKASVIFHKKNLNHKKIILLKNFIFAQTYFLIASSQIFKNHAILINHRSFFWGKYSLQLDRFQFLKINSLMTVKPLKLNFPKQNLFPEKLISDLLESHHFLKFGIKR